MNTILVSTDFSPTSEKALQFAIQLALKDNSEIMLLHSMELTLKNMAYTLVTPALRQFHEESIRKIRKEIKKVSFAGVKNFDYLITKAPVAKAVKQLTTEKKICLVVIGNHGNGECNLFETDHASLIIEQALAPVIVIPSSYSTKSAHDIIFATDYHDSDAGIIKELSRIANLTSSKVKIIHVTRRASAENEERFRQFKRRISFIVRDPNITFQTIISNNVEETIYSEMKKQPADILALSTMKRSRTDKLFCRSITCKMSKKGEFPVLVYHHSKPTFLI